MPTLLTFYSEIVPGDSARVLDILRRHSGGDVEVRINSPGGSVSEGLAIFNALLPYSATVYVDGIAASIASLIMMAGARRIAAANAIVMIHDPWCDASGNAAEFRRHADMLDVHRDAMLHGYGRAGIAPQRLAELMAAETWMSADEALALGFVTEIAEPLQYAAHAPGCFARYHKVPEFLTMPNNMPAPAGARGNAAPPSSPPAAPPGPGGNPPAPGFSGADENAVRDAFRTGLASDAVTSAAFDAVSAALQARNTQIRAIARGFDDRAGVRDLVVATLADPRASVDSFRDRLMSILGQGAEPVAGWHAPAEPAQGGGDFAQAAADSLLIRAGIRIVKPHPGVRDVSRMSMQDLVNACIARSGRSGEVLGSSGSRVRAAMTTGDFPSILENALNKSLRNGYEAEPGTFTAWTRKVTADNFRPQARSILGSMPDLLPVSEGGEYQAGSVDDDKALPYAVGKFGRIVPLTWEAMVNDDLGAFLRMVQGLGQAASRAEADTIYSTFSVGSGVGPLMQDGKALFHADHGNITSPQSGLNADAMSAARVLLRRQRALGGGYMNLPPRFRWWRPNTNRPPKC